MHHIVVVFDFCWISGLLTIYQSSAPTEKGVLCLSFVPGMFGHIESLHATLSLASHCAINQKEREVSEKLAISLS